MDCLFHDSEQQALDCYIEELRAKQITPMLYIAPDFDFPIINMHSSSKLAEDGYVGKYEGTSVYIFDGLDEHTCCVLPDFNTLPF